MRETELDIQTNDGVMDTFICYPEEGGPHPAIIMYMDAPGIREELRDMARRLSSVGYYVLLPNMYYRIGREGHYGFNLAEIRSQKDQLNKMFKVMNSLDNSLVVSDTARLLDHIHHTKIVSKAGVGCVGYCMSGQYVVSVAATYPEDFCAIASFYGVGIITNQNDSPHLLVNKIKGEVYLAFAEKDIFVPQEIVTALPAILSDAGVNNRVEVYPGTEHGFAFPQRPAYRKDAGERHWERIFALCRRNLL